MVRAFYTRQVARLIEHAGASRDNSTTEALLHAAKYYLDKLAALPVSPDDTGSIAAQVGGGLSVRPY